MSRAGSLLEALAGQRVTRVPLGELTLESKERNDANAFVEVRSVTKSPGLVRTSDFFDHARTSKDTKNYKVVRPGMYVYNPSRINVGSVAWLTEPLPVIVSPMYVVFRPDATRLLPEYLQLFFDSHEGKRQIESRTEVGARFRLTYKALARIQLQLPSIEVQRAIVETLRTFTDLRAELTAELEARRIQFAFYRDQILSFANTDDVSWAPLGEVGHFLRGRRFVKDDVAEGGIPAIHYGEIYTRYGATATEVAMYLRPDLARALRYAEPGDVVIVDVGETVEDVGKAVAWLGDQPVAIHDHSFAFRHSQNPSYISYYLQTSAFHREKAKYVARTKVKTLSMPGIAKIPIPIAPLAEQERIVGTLGKFEALVKDVSIGLPAELNARRRQYEYYRDRLLTFSEAA